MKRNKSSVDTKWKHPWRPAKLDLARIMKAQGLEAPTKKIPKQDRKKDAVRDGLREIKQCIQDASMSKVLTIRHCSGPHYQILGGADVVNFWPASRKMHANGAGKSIVYGSARELIDYALGDAFKNGPVKIHKAPNTKALARAKRPPRVDAPETISGPRCLHCRRHVTLKDQLAFDNGRIIHLECRSPTV